MKVAQDTRLNDWLLGSTVMCPSCGCIWLVPMLKMDDAYRCRQCGYQVVLSKRLTKQAVNERDYQPDQARTHGPQRGPSASAKLDKPKLNN